MKKNILNNNWFWVAAIFVTMMVVHLVLIQLWDITSTTYKPIGLLDNATRAPENIDDWFIRREHGVCPFDFRDYDIRHPFKGFENC